MNSKSNIVIFGAGGHGKVVLDILLESGFNVLGFLDDNERIFKHKINGYEILGNWSYIRNERDVKVALGIGNNTLRRDIYNKAKSFGLEIVKAIHPKSIVSPYAEIDEGVVVMPGAVINSSSILKEGVVINTGATVDHDCYIGSFAQIWPGAHLAGIVHIGENSYIGTGASVIQNIQIGRNTIIGAGATVINDIPDSVTAVGVPAKVIKKSKDAKIL